jgi:hypothetical protein
MTTQVAPLILAILWLLFFTAGMIVETATSRFFLAPIGTLTDKSGGLDEKWSSALSLAITGSVPTTNSGTWAAQKGNASLDIPALLRNLREAADNRSGAMRLYDYLICLVCYSPANIAVLSLIAGAMGGAMSSLYVSGLSEKERTRLAEHEPLTFQALVQSPWAAAVEGLIAYVCLVAGLYVLVDDPFRNPTPASYTKLAGIASAVAFAVGYDHNRFSSLLSSIPVPGGTPRKGGNQASAKPSTGDGNAAEA